MMRSVVSEKIGRLPAKTEASLPTATSGLPSDEKATAWIGWVWITAFTSGRARSTSEWMNTSLWRGIAPSTLRPSVSTVMILSGRISSMPMPAGFIRKRPGSSGRRTETWPAT